MTSSSSINSSPSPVTSAAATAINPDEHLIDPIPVRESFSNPPKLPQQQQEEEHLIDPHPIQNIDEHLIDPHPIEEEHLIDPHPIMNDIEEHLIDPHPIQLQAYKSNVLNQDEQQKLVNLIEPVPMNTQFNTQPQYAQQQQFSQPGDSVPRSNSYQHQDASSSSERK